MLERRTIRVLVVYNKLLYFLDGARQRGTSYEGALEFQKFINKEFKTGTRALQVIFIPVVRDQLGPKLIAGQGDIAIANLSITEERKQHVDFADPVLSNVQEIVITHKDAVSPKSITELSGMEIHVRKSSSYYQSLVATNTILQQQNLDPINIVAANENLEDDDLLEMVNANLLPAVVVDGHKAKFWKNVFPNIKVSEAIVREGGDIGWAIRKGSPLLKDALNKFIASNKKGSLFGNILYNRYLKNNKWARNALDEKELAKLDKLLGLFEQYGERYNFDALMLAALGYQESGLNQQQKSSVGAIGIMQVLPTTAADKNVGVANIHKLENNIHAGAKYLRFLNDRYFNQEGVSELNRTLLTFASYNAGPAKIRRLRKEAAEQGFDPNVWFGNVEVIAAKRIGRETVQYVGNIYKYYIAYTMVTQRKLATRKAKNAG